MGMSKTFRPFDIDQPLLLPPDLRDWLPEQHLGRFILDIVDELDLSPILSVYERGDGRGKPPYHPKMMVGLLLYAYCTGRPSSRKIEAATYTDVAFRVLAANQHPDHDSIADFRKRHLEALGSLFVQVLQLCERAGLISLGHVALDGTKVLANASKHKAMSYSRMGEAEQKLEAQIAALLDQAQQADAAEDAQFGTGCRGDELPAELARRQDRLAKIREAKAALEQEAREKAEHKAELARARIEERRQKERESGKKALGPEPKVPDVDAAVPKAKAQRNFTDAESRIMQDGASKSYVQAYNCQAAVDSVAQIVVCAEVTQQANDKQQLAEMLVGVEANMGRLPDKVSADSGYYSERQLTDSRIASVDLYVAVGRESALSAQEMEQQAPGIDPCALKEQMRAKLQSESGRCVYKRRKAIVEPVFGQTKEARGFRRFGLRGLVPVSHEWKLICLTHNLLKLFRSGTVVRTSKGATGPVPGVSGALSSCAMLCLLLFLRLGECWSLGSPAVSRLLGRVQRSCLIVSSPGRIYIPTHS